MPNSTIRTLLHPYRNDLYEIHLGGPDLVTLIRYRHGNDGHGEPIDFDTLSPDLQSALYSKVKHDIELNGPLVVKIDDFPDDTDVNPTQPPPSRPQ